MRRVVVDIPDEIYDSFVEHMTLARNFRGCKLTELPKGCGRLFDEKDIVRGDYEVIGGKVYELEPVVEDVLQREALFPLEKKEERDDYE